MRDATIFYVNEGAIKLTENPFGTNRTKHIDIRHHIVREKVANHTVRIIHVQSEKRSPDGLTKTLSETTLTLHRKTLLNEWIAFALCVCYHASLAKEGVQDSDSRIIGLSIRGLIL